MLPPTCLHSATRDIRCQLIWSQLEEGVEIEGTAEHGEGAVFVAGPLFFRAVPVEFDAVAVRVAKVKGFTNTVVGGAFEGNSSSHEAAQRVGKFGARRIENGKMIEARGLSRRRRTASALPSIQPNVMMIAASGQKGGAAPVKLRDLKAQDVAIESEGAIEIGDLQMDVADGDTGMERAGFRFHRDDFIA
jgi:hypothetical protein